MTNTCMSLHAEFNYTDQVPLLLLTDSFHSTDLGPITNPLPTINHCVRTCNSKYYRYNVKNINAAGQQQRNDMRRWQ